MNKTGIKFCKKCEERTPYDRMENRKDSPIKCLVCEDNKIEALRLIKTKKR